MFWWSRLWGAGKYLEMLDTPEQVLASNPSRDQKEQLKPLADLGQVRWVASPAAATPSEPQLISFPIPRPGLTQIKHKLTTSLLCRVSLSAFLIKCFPLCLSMSTAISTPCPTFNQGVNMGLFCEKKAWQHKHKQYQAWHWIQCWLHQTILQLLFYFFETHLPAIAKSLFYSSIYQPWHDILVTMQIFLFNVQCSVCTHSPPAAT